VSAAAHRLRASCFAVLVVLAACDGSQRPPAGDSAADADGHVAATAVTARANAAVAAALPLGETTAFDDARRGFVATDDPLRVEDATGRVIWDRPAYDFVTGPAPASVNPSLWRQAELNGIHGLFAVTDGVHQVRGYDLSNMSVIEGASGRILVDPLTTVETARRALALVNRALGDRPVVAVILTHSHIDHFGGVAGVVRAEDVRAGKVRLVAPQAFLAEAVSENVLAGTVMGRRAMYMYGAALSRSPRGHVDSGLGKEPAMGTSSILEPTDTVDRTGQRLRIDGVDFVFQYVPHSEAPAELTFHLPAQRAFCGAEIVSQTMHNLYTLRGAKVRDARLWSGYIDDAIERFGAETDVVFNSHHWPVWGRDRVIPYLQQQRDTYAYLHDQTLRLAAQGLTPDEIAETIRMPASLRGAFPTRGYYGTAKHNARAVYQFYFGWFDGNPARLDPLPAAQAATRYVEAMGGAGAVIERARAAYDDGEYRWAATLLDHVVMAAPGHAAATDLLARTYDQLGYQAESGPWRDVYLSGAQELRHGVRPRDLIAGAENILDTIPLDLFFAAMATRVNGPEADGEDLTVNFVFTDVEQTFVLRLHNAVLHHREAPPDPHAAATVRLTRATWLGLVTRRLSIPTLLVSDDFTVEGSRLKLLSFFRMLDEPNVDFPIVTR
jgi:alkyl sulfatase BDS1-like metallo-beta-lactamase superfamily hydrolase